MNLKDMLVYLRESILDDTGGDDLDYLEVTNEDDQRLLLRWTNEELIQFINQGINEACRNSLLLFDDGYSIKTVDPKAPDPEKVSLHGYTYDAATGVVTDSSGNIIDVVTKEVKDSSGTVIGTITEDLTYGIVRSYSYEPEILRIERVYDEKTKRWLEPIDLFDLKTDYRSEGDPVTYSTNYSMNRIYLGPAPIVPREIQLFVYRLPKKPLKKFKDAPEIKEVYHIPCLWYAAFLAYQKDEPNTLDTTRAQQFKAQFDQYFGRNSAYSDKRKIRNKRRTVRYGGL